MNSMTIFKKISLIALLMTAFTFTSCKDDDDLPPEENDLETITDVALIFTNTQDDQDVVTATAEDPDGIGIDPLTVDGPINLDAGKTYVLTFTIENHLAEEEEEEHHEEEEEGHEHGFDIAEEIEEEADEHQFFFSFTNDAFTDPTGTGNIDNSGTINYNDFDSNNNPLGLSTNWTTGTGVSDGKFTVRLQHQPDVKTSTSGANDGDTDFELEFVLNITNNNLN